MVGGIAHSSGIRHLGVIVADLERALSYYSENFGLGPWYKPRFTGGENFLRGVDLIHTEYAIASTFSGGVEFQLIHVRGGDRDVCAEFLEQHGEGIHHVGMYVKNLDECVAAYRARGIGVLQSGRLPSAGQNGMVSRYAYLETDGIVLELIEMAWRGIPIPSSRLVFELGCLSGAVEKVNRAHAAR